MIYRADLAHVHDAGFGDIARDAATRLLAELAQSGHRTGTVVDLGCGSGILAHIVSDAGYEVMGTDVSDAMLALARLRAPKARFQLGSGLNITIPACVAVCATGEVLNYSGAVAIDDVARVNLFRRTHDALRPGGVFLFDVAGMDRLEPGAVRQTFTEGSDWVVLAETSRERGTNSITRRIITFRRNGADYRRDDETHRLALLDVNGIAEELRAIGFNVQMRARYDEHDLPAGVTAFICHKTASS